MIYVASKTRHAAMWREYKAAGLPINSTWIYEAGPGETDSFQDLWIRCISEASEALCLIAYAEDGDILKGAFIEIGAALASGKNVLVVGFDPSLSFLHHPLVSSHSNLNYAILKAMEIVRNEC
jgi:hypothetical protein